MKASIFVNILEELRVLVGVPDVHKLGSLSHKSCNPLPHLDPDGVLKRKQVKVICKFVFNLKFIKVCFVQQVQTDCYII